MNEKIFITLGSQKFQFNRLLIAVDKLCEKKVISGEDVFAQTGYSDYVPRNYSYNNFLDRDEFSVEMGKADIVITHGGTGAIIGAVKKGKKVIAVPRRAKYGEHVDDHQLQLIKQFDLQRWKIATQHPCKLLNKQKRKEEIIVSLTSFPGRIHLVHKTIQTILLQSVKPDLVELWLAKEQFPNYEKDLPNELTNLIQYGLKICWCSDYRSFKKLVPSLQEHPDAIIVTADDDVYYPQYKR